MTDNELLAVIDREAELLDADNWHASAAILREAAELVRRCRAPSAAPLSSDGTIRHVIETDAKGKSRLITPSGKSIRIVALEINTKRDAIPAPERDIPTMYQELVAADQGTFTVNATLDFTKSEP